jgi:hypothetical protein
MAIVASTGDVPLAAGATTETGGAFPDAEDSAVGSVTVVPSVAAHVASVVAVDVASVAAHVASVVAVDVASVAAHVASVVADMPLVVVDVASVEADMPLVEAEEEAVPMEAVPTVVGADRLHH